MIKKARDMAKNPDAIPEDDMNIQYENAIVSNAIQKIGALLSLVFGSAGA